MADVGRRDCVKGFIGGERVLMVIAYFIARGRGKNTAVPGRDGAFGVAGGFGAEGGEVGAETGGFGGLNRSVEV